MVKTTFNPSEARENLYQLLKEVNRKHTEIYIVDELEGNNAVLIGLDDWKLIQETLRLEENGVLNEVRESEKDKSGFSDISEIDWGNL